MNAPRLNPRQRFEHDYGLEAERVLSRVDDLAAGFSDPDDIVRAVRRFITGDGRVATELRSLDHDPIALECLVRLAGCSRFGLGIAIFEYGQFWSVVQERLFRQVFGRRSMREEWEHFAANQQNLDGRVGALISFQHRHLLRITLGDLMGDWSFAAITNEIADLADVCIQAALDIACEDLADRMGPLPGSFTVFAMGKLGARELNYSSDIDLIFAYRRNSEADSSQSHDYFCRLGQEVIRILDTSFPQGRLYRVDMRLRPEGDSGELALSARELLDYCYSVGRSWERQAWIKARPVAGDLDLGHKVIDDLQPWIFPIDPRWEELKDASAMRLRIEERSQNNDVKVGSGGIRDIEFLVQYYQLGWGGRLPELRRRSTLECLDALLRHGLLGREDHEQLGQFYEWLRMVEHRLQMWESRQIHELPNDMEQRRHLANRCGYLGEDGLQRFEADLTMTRVRVRQLAESHYLTCDDERAAAFALINAEDPSSVVRERLLTPVGFQDPDRALGLIRALAKERFFLLRRSRTEHALADLLPDLLADIRVSPRPDRALHNFVRIVESVGGRAIFYEQLLRQSDTRRRLTNLAGWADALVDTLVAHPGLADEVVERLHRGVPNAAAMDSELHDATANQEQVLPMVAFFQARELVATAIEDLEGMAPWAVSRHLSEVSAAILRCLFAYHRDQLAQRWGLPQRADGSLEGCAILGLGKAGSGEMSYSSDLDVIMVCAGDGRCPDGEHDGSEFWERVCRNLIRDCHEARLYEIDARLRPWGEQGALVVSQATLESYWSKDKELWERLANTRLGHLAGDSVVTETAIGAISRAVFDQSLAADARQQLINMRQRLEASVSGKDHVKRGPGGYVDAEFLVQYALLGGLRHFQRSSPEIDRHALQGLSARAAALIPAMLADLHERHPQLPQLPIGIPIADALVGLNKRGDLCDAAAADLLVGVSLLRWIESRMRLYAGTAISHLPTDADERMTFARCAGYDSLQDMDKDLHLVRERLRHWFDFYTAPD
ncbi:MAG: hypothetical protein EA402_10880 [Planctomycetota bacterium]|nr:MAG: hypothetical protein EA402_10880 [Planctomycetota bacterium]